MSPEIEEIRYLTKFFSNLQGLRWIPFGVWLILVGLNYYDVLPWESISASDPFFISTVTLVLLFAAYGVIGMYYQASYGEVVGFKRSYREKLIRLGLGLLTIPVMGFDNVHSLPVSLTMIYIGICMIYDNWHGMKQNVMYLWAVAIILYAFFIPSATTHSYPANFFILCGVLLITTGVYLHFQFVRRFRSVREKLVNYA